ncbi:hypothetical protein [Helicobacter sp.]|uniref:hypothetical protein n=1 Tax=Helicobacter sp. TaxID=218 RepID=UPI00388DC51D
MALILLVSAIIATIVLIFQATLTIAIIALVALLSVSYLGFEAIWLWHNNEPYSTAWFVAGWLAVAFWLYVVYNFARRNR